MIKDNSTGKDKDFYSTGKRMFDNIEVIHPKRKEPTMTDLRQSAQQALEALQYGKPNKAITILREALEKPEQEPVAWMTEDECDVYTRKQVNGYFQHDHIPLYTTPPQRKWVGLTDEEIWKGLTDADWSNIMDRRDTALDTFQQGAVWAADILKERNHG